MAIRSFLKERRLVSHAGRRFIAAAPTCETVVLATSLFALEISALWQRHQEISGAGVEPLAVVLPHLLDPPRAARVLATCVELAGADTLELEALIASDRDVCGKLARAVLSLCDPSAIAASLDLEAARAGADSSVTPPKPGQEAPSALERIVDEVARRYGVTDPRVVMSWPYEMVLSCMALLNEDLCSRLRTNAQEAGGRSLDEAAEDLSRMGVHVSSGGARG